MLPGAPVSITVSPTTIPVRVLPSWVKVQSFMASGILGRAGKQALELLHRDIRVGLFVAARDACGKVVADCRGRGNIGCMPYRIFYYFLALCFVAVMSVAFAVDASLSEIFDPTTVSSTMIAWCMIPLGGLGLHLTVRMMRRNYRRPVGVLLRVTSRNRWWLVRSTLLFAVMIPASRAFMGIKDAIPRLVPFYADPLFARVDAAIFGQDPWRMTHAIIPDVGTLLIDRIYLAWFSVLFVLLTWFCFSTDQRFQLRGVLAMFFSWFLLGNVLAIAAASVGPIFYADYYGDDRFLPLLSTLEASPFQVKALVAAEWMRASNFSGAAVSAMPSMHVAVSWLAVLAMADKFGLRWPTWPAIAFFWSILVGSVHLGWHYAIDGFVSVLGVSIIWFLLGKVIPVAAPSRSDDGTPFLHRPNEKSLKS